MSYGSNLLDPYRLAGVYAGRILKGVAIAAGLEKIAAHPRCRLPRAEIHMRIVRYRAEK